MLSVDGSIIGSCDIFSGIEHNYLKNIKNYVNEIVIETIKNINLDTERRLNFKNNIKLIEQGIYYPHDYANVLKHNINAYPSCEKLRQYMLNKGVLVRGLAPQDCFTYLKDESNLLGFKNKFYVIKSNANASQALTSLIAGRTFLGCAQVCMVAYYEAIRTFLGNEKFDFLFSGSSKTPLTISLFLEETPLARFVTIKNIHKQSFEKGDMVFFQQVSEYAKKHFAGHGDGYNVICSGDSAASQFYGFMLDNQGLNNQQISDLLLNEYNKKPVPNDHIFAGSYLEILNKERDQTDAQKTLTKEKFKESGGGIIHPEFMGLNIEYLNKLRTYSLQELKSHY